MSKNAHRYNPGLQSASEPRFNPEKQLIYSLKRAGPSNFNRFQSSNFLAPKIAKFNFASKGIKDLDKINLKKIIALEMDQQPAQTLVYIETLEGSLILQPTDSPARHLFSYYLMKEMKVHVPETRIVCYNQRLMKNMVWEVERYLFVDIGFQRAVLEVLNKPYWILRSYTPFVTLDKVKGVNTKECLNALFPGGRKRLVDSAYLSAVDMLLNNSNRMPNVLNHRGNPLNLKFAIKESFELTDDMIRDPSKSRLSFDDLVVYNADVNPLNKAESQERLAEVNNYIIEVETLVETMCLNLREIIEAKVDPLTQSDHHWDSISRYLRFISHFTGYELTTMAEFQILLGVILGFQMLVRFGMTRIKRIKDLLAKRKYKDNRGIWDRDLEKIHLGFFEEILHKIDRILIRFDAVIAYGHSVTVGQFSLNFALDLTKPTLRELLVGAGVDLEARAALKAEERAREAREGSGSRGSSKSSKKGKKGKKKKNGKKGKPGLEFKDKVDDLVSEDLNNIPGFEIKDYKGADDFSATKNLGSPRDDSASRLATETDANERRRIIDEVDSRIFDVFGLKMPKFEDPDPPLNIHQSIIKKGYEDEDDAIDETIRNLESKLGGGRGDRSNPLQKSALRKPGMARGGSNEKVSFADKDDVFLFNSQKGTVKKGDGGSRRKRRGRKGFSASEGDGSGSKDSKKKKKGGKKKKKKGKGKKKEK